MKKSTQQFLMVGAALAAAYVVFGRHGRSAFHGLGREIADNLDVSRNEDLAGGCMHLISLEEHLCSSFSRTDDASYLDQIDEIRKMRREAMAKLLPPDAPGENWCIVKHLLGGAMRMNETASKLLTEGDRPGASRCYGISSQMKNQALDVANQRGSEKQCSVCQGG